MPFKYSKLTDESPSFFFFFSLEYSKNLLYFVNINLALQRAEAVHPMRKKISLNPKINLEIK